MKMLAIAAATLISFGASAAQLEVGDNVSILSINGQSPVHQSSLMELGNGPQVIAVKYNELFADNFVNPQFIRSGVHIVRFDVEDGKIYRLMAPTDMDQSEAQQYAYNPEFTISSSADRLVAHRSWSQNELLSQVLSSVASTVAVDSETDDLKTIARHVVENGWGEVTYSAPKAFVATY